MLKPIWAGFLFLIINRDLLRKKCGRGTYKLQKTSETYQSIWRPYLSPDVSTNIVNESTSYNSKLFFLNHPKTHYIGLGSLIRFHSSCHSSQRISFQVHICICWQAWFSCHVGLSMDCLNVLTTWQLAGPTTCVGPNTKWKCRAPSSKIIQNFKMVRVENEAKCGGYLVQGSMWPHRSHTFEANSVTWMKGRTREQSKQKPQSSCNLISKMIFDHFCCSLFIRSKWKGPSHT